MSDARVMVNLVLVLVASVGRTEGFLEHLCVVCAFQTVCILVHFNKVVCKFVDVYQVSS